MTPTNAKRPKPSRTPNYQHLEAALREAQVELEQLLMLQQLERQREELERLLQSQQHEEKKDNQAPETSQFCTLAELCIHVW